MALMLCDSEFIDQATGQCLKWVEQVTLLDQLAITPTQMAMLGTPIISIYSIIIAFIMFNNFAKRA
ncbi:hypothetical protein ACPC5U_13330 [Acinetobacter haemolyticus]|uniref:hypothetical protein n=1 Tax=Acinetobacter haemolyticus TaxID=29430 RepID=UPI003C1D2D44